MKKVLSFVLVLAMILGSFSMAFADVYTAATDEDEDYVVPFEDAQDNIAALALKDLGILNGDTDGKVYLDRTMTRAELCAMLMRALGHENLCAQRATNFTDVAASHWASGYIAVAQSMGYVDGVTATEFAPDAKVTNDQAITMVLKCLGYDETNMAEYGTWPTNYVVMASDLGILQDVTTGSTEATRSNVFQFVFQSLNQNIVKWNKDAEEFQNRTPVVSIYKRVTGTVRPAASVYTSGTGVVGYDDDSRLATLDNDVDITEYVGKNVRYLIAGGDIDTGKKVSVMKVLSTTLEGKFSDDFTTFTAVDGTAYTVSGAAAVITTNALRFVNAGTTTTGLFANITSKTSVTLEVKLDSKKTTTITELYSVKTWARTAVYQADATAAAFCAKEQYASAAAALHDGCEKAFALTGQALDADYPVIVEGYALNEIQDMDIVELYVDANGVVSKIIVTRDVVEGPVTRINTYADPDEYTIGSNVYKVDSATAESVEFPTAITTGAYRFYLASTGKIVAGKLAADYDEEADVDDEYSYAYVLATNVAEDKTSGTLDTIGKVKYDFQIRLLPFGATEYVDYTGISYGALNACGFTASTTQFAAAVKYGLFVQYKLDEDGEIAEITASAVLKKADADKKFDTKGIDGKLFASDVKVVVRKDFAATTKASFYVPTDVDDLVGKKYLQDNIYYYEEDGKIEMVQISGSAVGASDYSKITAAAVIGTGVDSVGTFATIINVSTAEVETIYTKGVNGTLTSTGIYTVEFIGAKYVTIAAIADAAYTTVEGITAGALKKIDETQISGSALRYNLDSPVVLVYNKTDKVYELGTFADVKGDADIALYKIDSEYYNLITVKAN